MTENLTTRSLKAGSWLVAYNGFARAAGVIKIAILARLLTPAQFGAFGIVTLALSLLETFSETSVFQALIQKDTVTDEDLTASWLISIARGALIALLLYISAPFIQSFFNQDGLVPFIRLIALAPLIRNFRNPQTVHFQKDLNFKKESFLRALATLVELIVAITVTLATHSIWGLVLANVASAFTEAIGSFLLAPTFVFVMPTWSTTKPLIHYGSWLWGSSILSYIATEGDDIVVGKLLGAGPLGFYQNAYKIASLPVTQITSVTSQVGFPALSQIQDDKQRLARAFKKTLLTTIGLTTFASVAIFIFAGPITLFLFGENWLPMVPALRLLTLFGLIRSIDHTAGPLFKAVGKPNLVTLYGTLFIVVMFALIFPLTRSGGIVGTSWAIIIAALVTQPYLIYHVRKILSSKTPAL